jgi:F-type H+-transporting ATPase subunit epsilon
MKTLQVDVVSAEEEVFSGQAQFVALPGELGELGILPGHAPFITRVRPGTVRIKTDQGQEELLFVAGGILEVQPGGVSVLADTVIRGKDLDEAKVNEAKRLAEQALQTKSSDMNYASAQAELAIAFAQLSAIRRVKGNK